MAGARPPDAAAARRFCALPRDLQGSAMRTREGPCGGCGRAARIRRGERPWPRLPQRAPKPARSRRFCARLPRRAAAAGRAGASSPHILRPRVRIVSVHDRRRRAAAAGRAGASPPHIPWPRVRIVPVHGRRGVRGGGTGWRFPTPHPMAARSQRSCARPPRRARRRDGPALLHPTSHGRAFAALKFIPCAGRICAYSRCAAAASASAQSVRSQGRSRSARPKWP